MFKKIFIEHPQTVDETYGEHFVQATSFSAKMFLGAGACFVHAFIPCLCKTTGSGTIIELHDRMVTNRHAQTSERRETPAGGLTESPQP